MAIVTKSRRIRIPNVIKDVLGNRVVLDSKDIEPSIRENHYGRDWYIHRRTKYFRLITINSLCITSNDISKIQDSCNCSLSNIYYHSGNKHIPARLDIHFEFNNTMNSYTRKTLVKLK